MSEVEIQAGRAVLSGNLIIPQKAVALVLFAHGSGSSRHSPRNLFVARTLNDAGLATLLFDLLTQEEEAMDMRTREHRFNIGLLAERLVHAARWAKQQKQTRDLRTDCHSERSRGIPDCKLNVAARDPSTPLHSAQDDCAFTCLLLCNSLPVPTSSLFPRCRRAGIPVALSGCGRQRDSRPHRNF